MNIPQFVEMKLSGSEKSIFGPVQRILYYKPLQTGKRSLGPVKILSTIRNSTVIHSVDYSAELVSSNRSRIRVFELSEAEGCTRYVELDNEWLVMVDGAARGNPGRAGCGAVILDENGRWWKGLSCYLRYVTNQSRGV